MSANVATILCFIGFLSVGAIRDEAFRLPSVDGEAEQQSSCPEAKIQLDPPFPTRFEVPSGQAKFLDFFDDWTLKESRDCASSSACDVSVAPVFNISSPLNSTALITAKATCTRWEQSHQLFLCPRNGTGTCVAAVRFPARGWKLRHLAGSLITATRMQRMDAMGEEVLQDFLEALFLLNVLFTLGVLGWLLREIILNRRKGDPSGEDTEAKTDPHLVVPSSLDIMFEGMLDAVCFIVGCGLLLVAASTFLQKFGTGNNPADVVLLCYPLIFGPVALLRIFMSFNRRLLYHNLFLKGVMIDFSYAATQRDPLLLYTYVGLATAVGVLLFDAWQNVQEGNVLWKTMAIQTVVFTSPLYYMVSSLLDALRLEQEALKRMCMQTLEQGSDVDSIEPSSEHKLTPISEGIFCRAARERQDLNACIESAKVQESAERLKSATSLASLEGDDEDDLNDVDYFKLMDMFWVPRLVSGKESVSMLLVLSMPLVTLLAVLLGLASLAWLIKHRTDVPEIESLVTDVPGLTPAFGFEIMDYALFVPKLHGTITLSASANLERTHFMNVSVLDGDVLFEDPINTTARVLTEHVPLQRKNASYPTVVHFVASTLSKARTYSITVLEIHILVRSLLFRGYTKDGERYEQCYPFKGSWKGRAVAIPDNLQSLQMETAFQEFHMDLPIAMGEVNNSEFAVVFETFEDAAKARDAGRRFIRTHSSGTCATSCSQQPNCYGHKEVRGGCYYAIGPNPTQTSCLDLHRRKPRQNSRVQISAKFCNTHDAGNCAPTSSSDQVVTATLDMQVLRYPSQKSLQERTGHTSITMRASSALGSSLYPDVPHEVAFTRGVPHIKQLMYSSGKLQESLEKPDGTQQFVISLSYDPNRVKGRHLGVHFGAILEDYSDFQIQWDEQFSDVDLNTYSVYFKGLCTPALFDFQSCGGHINTFISQVAIDKWSPNLLLRGKVVSKSHPSLFRPRNLEIQVVFRDGLPPLQSIIRKNCNVPICRGISGHLDECLSKVNKTNCKDIHLCKDRCVNEVMEQCLSGAAARSVEYGKRESRRLILQDLGYVSYVPADLLPGHLGKNPQFLHWLDVQIYEPFQMLFTEDALVDVAEHCSFGSGLLSLLRPGRVNSSVSMVRIMEALVRNPNFSFNATFGHIPVLRAIFHDKKQDFIRPLGGLSSVALYQDSLRPLTLPVCLATDPRSPKFVNQDIYAHLLDKMKLAVAQKDFKEVSSSHAVLRALYRCLKAKGSRFQRFSPQECRSSTSSPLEDGSQPSFFSLAPTEEAFHDLLPVCETGGWMEKDNRTILHLAAARNFSKPFLEVLKSQAAIPDVNSVYMTTEMAGTSSKWIYLQIRGRTAMHEACRSGCVPCVEALLAKKALQDTPFNLTMFPSWWDPAFHPWMYEYLLKSSSRDRQRYKAMWDVNALHVATSHHCSGCLEALLRADSSMVDAKLSLGVTLSVISKKFTFERKELFGVRTDRNLADCSFRALDLAVMLNCLRCVQILLGFGADATAIWLDRGSKIENLHGLQLLPKNVEVYRCDRLTLGDKHQFATARMFSWI